METDFDTMKRGTDEVNREKLMSDFKTVARDAEELLKVTAGELGEKTKEARARLAATLDRAKVSFHSLEERAIISAKATDKTIREHPYQFLGMAFGAGLVMGLLIGRK